MIGEIEKLLSLIYQAGGQVMAKDGHLFVTPPAIAQRFGEQIKKFKPEILLSLGHCPTCAGELIGEKVRRLDREGKRIREGVFIHCQNRDHYEMWDV